MQSCVHREYTTTGIEGDDGYREGCVAMDRPGQQIAPFF